MDCPKWFCSYPTNFRIENSTKESGNPASISIVCFQHDSTTLPCIDCFVYQLPDFFSLRSWRKWVRARKLFCGEANSLRPRGNFRERRSRKRNSTRVLPILLATCAAFCTRVRDRSSRGYPLPPATQARFFWFLRFNFPAAYLSKKF